MINNIRTINNAITYINKNNTYIVEINGEEVKNEQDWLYIMAEKFHFPVFLEEEKNCRMV